MTTQPLDPRIQELIDRRDIEDCLLRYARGADRADADLLRSAYHDDAVDCRGPVPTGRDEFIENWRPGQPDRDVTQHVVSNVSIDFDGDTAHVESYLFVALKSTGETDLSLHGARNIDRFERRDGVWRIAVRVVVPSWHVKAPMVEESPALKNLGWSHRSPQDPSYLRPLTTWPPTPAS